jgi:uncharacterized membrane protein
MIEFTHTIVIERPLREVFSFISDFENMSKWNYYVLDVKKQSDGSVGMGTTYHQIRKTDQQRFQVVEYKPNQAVAIETLPPEKKLNMRFRFKSIENGTQIVDEWQLDTNTPGPLEWLAARRVKSAVFENLQKLKTLLETGHVELQDGRVTRYRISDPLTSDDHQE